MNIHLRTNKVSLSPTSPWWHGLGRSYKLMDLWAIICFEEIIYEDVVIPKEAPNASI